MLTTRPTRQSGISISTSKIKIVSLIGTSKLKPLEFRARVLDTYKTLMKFITMAFYKLQGSVSNNTSLTWIFADRFQRTISSFSTKVQQLLLSTKTSLLETKPTILLLF